jgi:hypothetical protein
MFAKVVAIAGANGELIVDVSELGRGSGQFQFCFQMEFAKELAITIRVVLQGCCPFIQIWWFLRG